MQIQPWEDQTFSDVGSKVLRVEPLHGAVLLVFQTSPGDGYTSVTGVDSNGQDVWLAVNTIGNYSGTTLYAQDQTIVAFKIQTDLGWSLGIRPVSQARFWSDASVTGIGDDVLQLSSPVEGFATVAIRTANSPYTGVRAYSDTAVNLLFNAAGDLDQETVLPAGSWLIEIQCGGSWSMART